MVGNLTFKITGADKLEAKLKGLGPAVAGKIGVNALTSSARPITAAIRRYAPVKTGKLKRSVTSQAVRANGALLSRVIGFRSPGRFYSHLVEFGTIKSAPHPFIRPALDATVRTSLLEMGRALFRGIEAYSIGRVLQTLDQSDV
jgi:HK97 gp10 family phage protein